MPQATKTTDEAYKLPPDKLSELTATVFAKYNSPFKVLKAKRMLNGKYDVTVSLKTGARLLMEI